jgi:chemotaxis protein histidine kinase CheA
MRNIKLGNYTIKVVYDPELKMFRGEILGLRGGADFYCKTESEIPAEFKKSLEVYLAVCRENNIQPFKPQDAINKGSGTKPRTLGSARTKNPSEYTAKSIHRAAAKPAAKFAAKAEAKSAVKAAPKAAAKSAVKAAPKAAAKPAAKAAPKAAAKPAAKAAPKAAAKPAPKAAAKPAPKAAAKPAPKAASKPNTKKTSPK